MQAVFRRADIADTTAIRCVKIYICCAAIAVCDIECLMAFLVFCTCVCPSFLTDEFGYRSVAHLDMERVDRLADGVFCFLFINGNLVIRTIAVLAAYAMAALCDRFAL